MEKIALLLNNSINLLSRKFDSLALELRNKKAPIMNSQISISEDVSKGISQAVERSLDKLVIPSPKITFPEYPKFPKIPTPIINIPETVVNVPPAQITVEPAKVEFPKEMKIEGMDKLLESVNRETYSGNIFDEVNSKKPLAVMILDSKGRQITDFGGEFSAPSTVALRVGTTTISSTNPLPVITRSALTANSPTFATVGVASAQALASNTSRKGLTITNTSSNTISIAFGATAVLNSGITLTAYASFSMDEYSFSTSAINCIASAVSSNLSIQEFQ